ncbi:SRPBCC domain-containing protein [Paenibacillus marinisediminis]
MNEPITSVKRSIMIHATPEQAWTTLTEPAERNRWETNQCELELVPGGVIRLDYGWGVTYGGIVKELEPNKRLVLEDEEQQLTIWSIEPHAEGCVVSIEYLGLWSGELGLMAADNMAFGTYQFMRNMKTVLEFGQDIRSTFWKSWIGADHRTYEEGSLIGTKVVHTIPGTPAYNLLKEGDIITYVNGSPIAVYDDLEMVITEQDVGKSLQLHFIRDGVSFEIELTTAAYRATVEIVN